MEMSQENINTFLMIMVSNTQKYPIKLYRSSRYVRILHLYIGTLFDARQRWQDLVTRPGAAGDRIDTIPSMSEDHGSWWSG